MLLDILYLVIGLILLVWSADKFVDGASATARYLGLSPLLIGIVIVGFGTSTPEMLVSASSALDGASGLALGNAYGSNIANIALILGATAVISPILVAKDVLKKELPALLAITALSAYFLTDATVTQTEAVIIWSGEFGMRKNSPLLRKKQTKRLFRSKNRCSGWSLACCCLWSVQN